MKKHRTPNLAAALVAELGEGRIAASLNLSDRTIRQWTHSRRIPARYFLAFEAMLGRRPSFDAFGFDRLPTYTEPTE